MANVHEANFELTNALSLKRTRKKEARKVDVMKWLYEKGIFHLLAGIMLGRAVVMLQFMPFALPFFAAVMIMQRQKAPHTFSGLTAGAAALGLLPFQEKHGECDKLIAPMLSSILQETVIVHQKGDLPPPYYGTAATFRSAKAFHVTAGVAHAAYDGGLVSGDSCAAIPIHEGKFAAAICDGMGNGEKAREESEETIGLLEEMLRAGIEEELAIKSVNSILTAKRTSDMYSTVDLAMIDLQNARARFLKVGAVPSYVKRGRQIQMIEAANLPLGFFHEMEMDVLEHQLKSGDILFMLSDGLIDGLRSIENPERWMRRQIAELGTTDPQEAADLLVESAVRAAGGTIQDDMTVIAEKIDHQVPKWAAIPLKRSAG
ncbi:stage II sporulation protein E [Jeotgalibacillus malaysiensis]|uniref:Stage II sporulation protein E n=1 Tax=Jeotgalibacillus malaysiensis TaxID=1508404 RepID=A0A0B5AGD8_9BACL|nr:SpoIIE family protein phosphatase [Jeotgalibacillus malaysiensis]AJD89400.1 stage II sporulation protein E [Jeotgalibacillus malaysiensis]